MQLGIFLKLPRVCEGSCKFLRTSRFSPVAGKRLFLLSPGRFSLRPRSPEVARSLQRPSPLHLLINGLRADESSGCFLASVGGGNRPDLESGEYLKTVRLAPSKRHLVARFSTAMLAAGRKRKYGTQMGLPYCCHLTPHFQVNNELQNVP